MKLYCYDRNKDLRIFEVADDTDLSKQTQLKNWIQKETGIQVFSAVVGLMSNKTLKQQK